MRDVCMFITDIKRDIFIENADIYICITIRDIFISYIDRNICMYLYLKCKYLILGVNRDISI